MGQCSSTAASKTHEALRADHVTTTTTTTGRAKSPPPQEPHHNSIWSYILFWRHHHHHSTADHPNYSSRRLPALHHSTPPPPPEVLATGAGAGQEHLLYHAIRGGSQNYRSGARHSIPNNNSDNDCYYDDDDNDDDTNNGGPTETQLKTIVSDDDHHHHHHDCATAAAASKHIYAIRVPLVALEESARPSRRHNNNTEEEFRSRLGDFPQVLPAGTSLYTPAAVAASEVPPTNDVVCVSPEHHIYIMDIGLSRRNCDEIVRTTELCSRGSYAAYTYAKQTLGCREYDELAYICQYPVLRAVSTILQQLPSPSSSSLHNKKVLVLDDREPHMVKYDVTKKERQKLDMHTDKSEWTFLIALSDQKDFTGGGTYFEALGATVHLQRGHALVFPGKLRHCGQKITSGLRFLLVGFLVDKSGAPPDHNNNNNNKNDNSSSSYGAPSGSSSSNSNKGS